MRPSRTVPGFIDQAGLTLKDEQGAGSSLSLFSWKPVIGRGCPVVVVVVERV